MRPRHGPSTQLAPNLPTIVVVARGGDGLLESGPVAAKGGSMSDKPVAQKLQIKPNRTVLFVNAPMGYEAKIAPLPEGVFVVKKPAGHVDCIQLFVESRADLERWVPELKKHVGSAGMFWVTFRKGSSGAKAGVNRDIIHEYAHAVGMQAVAQVAIDDDWSALRLKIV
jgi:hypothetical protein